MSDIIKHNPVEISENISGVESSSQKDLIKKTRSTSYFNVLFSGFALLSDGYQSGVISFVNLFLGKIYGPDVFNATMKSRLSYSMFVGAIVGQLGNLFYPSFYHSQWIRIWFGD